MYQYQILPLSTDLPIHRHGHSFSVYFHLHPLCQLAR
ncbi:Uncharacterised protein [Vibrio cholerae]|nr:Uncharacterised protein [Vibrio cholerae]